MTDGLVILALVSNVCAILGLTVKVAAVVHNIRKDLEILRKDLEISKSECTHLNQMSAAIDHQFKEALEHTKTSLRSNAESDKVEIRSFVNNMSIAASEVSRDLHSLERFIDKKFEEYSPRAK